MFFSTAKDFRFLELHGKVKVKQQQASSRDREPASKQATATKKMNFKWRQTKRQKYFLVVPFTKAFLTCGWQIASSNWIVARNPIFVSIFFI